MVFLEPSKSFSVVVIGMLSCLMACTGSSVQEQTDQQDTLVHQMYEDVEDSLMLYEEEPEPESADMLFADFFYAFITNPNYQQQRVVFPLRTKDDGGESVSLAQWKELNPFDLQEFYAVIYDHDEDMVVQNDTSVQRVAVDRIDLHTLDIDHYRFERLLGKWMLVSADTRHASDTPQRHFLNFYSHFAHDSVFQRQSIQFPLRLVSEPQDEEEDEGVAELAEEEWPEFSEQMPLPTDVMFTIDYGQKVISQNRKVLLMEGLSSSLFVKYKFDCTAGEWTLYEIDF